MSDFHVKDPRTDKKIHARDDHKANTTPKTDRATATASDLFVFLPRLHSRSGTSMSGNSSELLASMRSMDVRLPLQLTLFFHSEPVGVSIPAGAILNQGQIQTQIVRLPFPQPLSSGNAANE